MGTEQLGYREQSAPASFQDLIEEIAVNKPADDIKKLHLGIKYQAKKLGMDEHDFEAFLFSLFNEKLDLQKYGLWADEELENRRKKIFQEPGIEIPLPINIIIDMLYSRESQVRLIYGNTYLTKMIENIKKYEDPKNQKRKFHGYGTLLKRLPQIA